jgi:hypothetical protein
MSLTNNDHMSGKARVVLASCVVAVLFWGCEPKTATMPHRNVVIGNKADLQRLLAPGISTNEIIKTFGIPRLIDRSGQNEQVWHLSIHPFLDKSEGQRAYSIYVIGVIVAITNGHMAYWDCVTGDASNGSAMRTDSILSTNNGHRIASTIKFFLVSTNPIAQGRFVDTKRLPKLGYIAINPDLSIDRFKRVFLEERRLREVNELTRTSWVFRCTLDTHDINRFKDMTTINVLNRMLIMIGDEAIVAPTILYPVEDGNFEIECEDRSLMEAIRKQLEG